MSGTEIYSKKLSGGRQALVYSMTLEVEDAVAMILPLPTRVGAAEDAVEFVSLAGYRRFFDDLRQGFRRPVRTAGAGPFGHHKRKGRSRALTVHSVGALEASFVPRVADFKRLDPRFAIQPQIWSALPEVADWGFAVFQLRSTTSRFQVHPMAMTFPSRCPDALFFPTVHIHSDAVKAKARFDHHLYAQLPPKVEMVRGWQVSSQRTSGFVSMKKTQGLVSGEGRCFRRKLRGTLPNRDTWLTQADWLELRGE